MENTSAKKRILLVDDDMDTCLTFKKMLEEQDFDVHAFVRPQDVLENFMPGTYDLVVLDIKMPNIDGIKLYHQLRKVDKNVKVCFITASEEYYIEHFPELKEEKCFMQKPISLDNFVDRVKLALAESTI
jgi:DNA-binding response OmpR family regulator